MRRRKRRCIQMDAGQNILAGAELNLSFHITNQLREAEGGSEFGPSLVYVVRSRTARAT